VRKKCVKKINSENSYRPKILTECEFFGITNNINFIFALIGLNQGKKFSLIFTEIITKINTESENYKLRDYKPTK